MTRRERRGLTLADLTTLRLGGPARQVVEVDTEADLVAVVRECDEAGEPVLLVGGGSNLVVADDGFDGTAVLVSTTGSTVRDVGGGGVEVVVAAGVGWEDLVLRAQHEGWIGLEALAGIPGRTGATPIQNVGAYGQEVSQTITTVRVFDRRAGRECSLSGADCRFGYRTSRFKTEPHRFAVLSVTFRLPRGRLSEPIGYAELARVLGVELGERAPLVDVRDAVRSLRAAKGMVLDPGDHDTWSAGSFFTNPVLSPEQAERLPAAAPRYGLPDGRVKTSAAWLIEHAGFTRGYGDGPVRLSTKHTLALTNRGGARTADLLALARDVRAGVQAGFDLELEHEPVTVGCAL